MRAGSVANATGALALALALALAVIATPALGASESAAVKPIPSIDPRLEQILDSAEEAMAAGEVAVADARLRLGLVELGENSMILFFLGKLAEAAGETEQAMAFAERAIAADPTNMNAYQLFAAVSPPTWRKANVITRFLDGTRDNRADAVTRARTFASYDLAATLFSLGNFTSARRAFDVVARRTHPNLLIARWHAALTSLALGDSATAVADLETIIAAQRDHGAAQALLAAIAPARAPPLVVKPAGGRAPAPPGPRNRYAGFRLPAKTHGTWSPARVDYADIEKRFQTDFVRTRTPVVLKRGVLAALGWRIEQWNREYLKAAVPNITVIVQQALAQPGQFGIANVMRTAGFHDVLDALASDAVSGDGARAADAMYLNVQQRSKAKVPPMLLPLVADIPHPNGLVAPERLAQVNAWLSASAADGPGAQSSLHADLVDNLYFLARGRKRFRVASPADLHSLYFIGAIEAVSPAGVATFDRTIPTQQSPPVVHFSHIYDLTAPIDAARFPLAVNVPTCDIELEAGEALYLPASWAHHVTTWGDSLAVNLWWTPPSDDEVVSPAEEAREL